MNAIDRGGGDHRLTYKYIIIYNTPFDVSVRRDRRRARGKIRRPRSRARPCYLRFYFERVFVLSSASLFVFVFFFFLLFRENNARGHNSRRRRRCGDRPRTIEPSGSGKRRRGGDVCRFRSWYRRAPFAVKMTTATATVRRSPRGGLYAIIVGVCDTVWLCVCACICLCVCVCVSTCACASAGASCLVAHTRTLFMILLLRCTPPSQYRNIIGEDRARVLPATTANRPRFSSPTAEPTDFSCAPRLPDRANGGGRLRTTNSNGTSAVVVFAAKTRAYCVLGRRLNVRYIILLLENIFNLWLG